MLSLEFAELHNTLFLGGKNHGVKLKATPEFKLEYDRAEQELLVTYKKTLAIVPVSNVSSMVPGSQAVSPQKLAHPPAGKIKAQVSTPQDHVFADGPGKTRDQ